MKSQSPYASMLVMLEDKDIKKAVEVENRQEGVESVTSVKKQPLSSQAMKLIYGNDGTYINHTSVDNKLATWKREYLKRKSEPKKYEPMLYFHDFYRFN